MDYTVRDTSVKDSASEAAEQIKSTADRVATALNIQYIQRDIMEIKTSIEKLSGVFATREDLNETNKLVSDHEARIRTLESTLFKWMGIATAGGIAISIIGSYILRLIK